VFFGPYNLYAGAAQGIRHDQIQSYERPRVSAGAQEHAEHAA
jgi:hypothetical protein